uniref:Uncharacterized protein n=1 Tax=Guillardia theta TaxID=55529 RepID=A0A7S4P1C5_GUITH
MSGLATFSPSANAWMIPAQKFDPLAAQRPPVDPQVPPMPSASRRLFYNRQGEGRLQDPDDLISKIRSAVDELQSSQLMIFEEQTANLQNKKKIANSGEDSRDQQARSQNNSRHQTHTVDELFADDFHRDEIKPVQPNGASFSRRHVEQPADIRDRNNFASFAHRQDLYREAASSASSVHGDSHMPYDDRYRQTSVAACMQECDMLLENLRVLKYEKLSIEKLLMDAVGRVRASLLTADQRSVLEQQLHQIPQDRPAEVASAALEFLTRCLSQESIDKHHYMSQVYQQSKVVDEHERRIETLQSQLNSLQAKNSSLDKRLHELTTQNTSYRVEQERFAGERKTLEEEIKKLQNLLEDQHSREGGADESRS